MGGRFASGLDVDPPDMLDEPEKKGGKLKGILILLGGVGLAAGGVVGMRKYAGMGTSKVDAGPDIDAASKKASAIKGEIDKAVKDLSTDYTKGQVKGVKDPFDKGEPPPPPPPAVNKF